LALSNVTFLVFSKTIFYFRLNIGLPITLFLISDKILLTEEIHIKEDIETDSDDSEIAVTSKIKETPVDAVTAVEQLKIMGGPNRSQLVTQGNRDVFKTTRQKPDLTTLKKCYLVAVDVAPSELAFTLDIVSFCQKNHLQYIWC
jgi:hypothetical protein